MPKKTNFSNRTPPTKPRPRGRYKAPVPGIDEQGRFIGPTDVERGMRYFKDHHQRLNH